MKTKLILILFLFVNVSLFAKLKVVDVLFFGEPGFRVTVYNVDIDEDGVADVQYMYINNKLHSKDWVYKVKQSTKLDIEKEDIKITCRNKFLTINLGNIFSESENIDIKLYDIKGSKISNIYNGAYYENIQNSTDVPKGMYLAVLLIDDNVITKKIIIK